MKARRLIEGADFDPDTLEVVFAAFDAAWQKSRVTTMPKTPSQIEQARLQLAHVVLAAARDDGRDGERLKRDALQVLALRYKPRA